MGMYTELIFGAELYEDTPPNIIDALLYMVGDREDKPTDFPLPDGRYEWLFKGSSSYFGVSSPHSRMWFNRYGGSWELSTRSSIKNYDMEIESFLEWIKPYILSGSGSRDMYAIVTYEEGEPSIYYLQD